MVVARHATGTGTRPVGTAALRPAAPRRAPAGRPDPAGPAAHAVQAASPAAVARHRCARDPRPGPAAAPTEINLGALDLPGLGAVEGHGLIPPGPDATWHNQPPDFPREAQLRGEHGTVVVLIHVAPDGRASGADMVESSGWPILDRAVLQAVQMSGAYRPGRRDGVPVASELRFRVVFEQREAMMVRIDRVVTRGGDGGETSLGDGSRVRKDAARIEAIGAVDEANSAIGLLRLHAAGRETDAMLARIQNDLLDLGADLCVPGEGGDRLRLTDAPSVQSRAEVAAMNAGFAEADQLRAARRLARRRRRRIWRGRLVRRAERAVVQLGAEEPVGRAGAGALLNRLSDHLFVLARRLNAGGGRRCAVGARGEPLIGQFTKAGSSASSRRRPSAVAASRPSRQAR